MSRVCQIEDCASPSRASGYCGKHYQRFKKYGDPLIVTKQQKKIGFCTVDGCAAERKGSKLYCEKHRARMRRHGDVNVALKDHTPAAERWKTSYEVDPETGCWNWTGPMGGPYGFIQDGAEKRYKAHRFVYEQIVGPIPEGLVLDHLCKNGQCVNPAHLEPVTQNINAHRGGVASNSSKTQCDHGHEFTPENTYINIATGWRTCRACARRRMREGKYRYEYVYLYLPGHPLADRGKTPKVPEHRFVLYESIGAGPHPCNWCGQLVNWGGISGIHVDHLNGEPSDNRLENLVVSCQSCNKSRASQGNRPDWAGPNTVSRT